MLCDLADQTYPPDAALGQSVKSSSLCLCVLEECVWRLSEERVWDLSVVFCWFYSFMGWGGCVCVRGVGGGYAHYLICSCISLTVRLLMLFEVCFLMFHVVPWCLLFHVEF